MTHWMCSKCGYYLQGTEPPNKCPGCNQYCVFQDVTCYRPECGGENNIDPLLVGAALGTLTTVKQRTPKESALSGVGALQKEIIAGEPKGLSTSIETFTQAKIFNGLNEQQKQQLTRLGKIRNYSSGDVVCIAGTESRGLLLVEEGEVMVELEYSKGMYVPISVLGPGQAFSWSALLPPYRHTSTVVALSKTKVNAIERDALLEYIKDFPAVGVTLMENIATLIASRLANLEAELVGLLMGSQSAPEVLHIQLQPNDEH
jgi:CRP-like cAMP-binding protein